MNKEKFKTLKDLNYQEQLAILIKDRNMPRDLYVEDVFKVIKAEAIKWVKEKDMENGSEAYSDFCEFHNITEEDLK